jgi:hypothetical protein
MNRPAGYKNLIYQITDYMSNNSAREYEIEKNTEYEC